MTGLDAIARAEHRRAMRRPIKSRDMDALVALLKADSADRRMRRPNMLFVNAVAVGFIILCAIGETRDLIERHRA